MGFNVFVINTPKILKVIQNEIYGKNWRFKESINLGWKTEDLSKALPRNKDQVYEFWGNFWGSIWLSHCPSHMHSKKCTSLSMFGRTKLGSGEVKCFFFVFGSS